MYTSESAKRDVKMSGGMVWANPVKMTVKITMVTVEGGGGGTGGRMEVARSSAGNDSRQDMSRCHVMRRLTMWSISSKKSPSPPPSGAE